MSRDTVAATASLLTRDAVPASRGSRNAAHDEASSSGAAENIVTASTSRPTSFVDCV
ncbi:hypothetical protein AB0M48_22360 [Lentzea sp. NPDC051208]|uniref:hypothetical protein n=1 Tax=Lentzea sp. NPDC051208 TaxID=3154642 RepID=UPI003417BC32